MQQIKEIMADMQNPDIAAIADPDVREACVSLLQTVQRVYAAETEKKTAAPTGTAESKDRPVPVVLPFPVRWPGDQRGIPTAMVRSTLFSVVRRGRRRHLDDVVLVSWPDAEIRYKGDQLDQADLDVYLEVLHRAQQRGQVGQFFPVTAYGILKAIGRSPQGKHQYRWLERVMLRLTACAVKITVTDRNGRRLTYAGSLVEGYYYDEDQKQYLVCLNSKLAKLFDTSYTRLAMTTRLQLRGDLAKWLHGYVCSHKATPTQPHRIGLTRLRELCGAEVREQYKWRQEVKQAMTQLEHLGVVVIWQINDDVLEFIRMPKGLPGQ